MFASVLTHLSLILLEVFPLFEAAFIISVTAVSLATVYVYFFLPRPTVARLLGWSENLLLGATVYTVILNALRTWSHLFTLAGVASIPALSVFLECCAKGGCYIFDYIYLRYELKRKRW